MSNEVLDNIKENTKALIAQNLRSKAIVITRLYSLISNAYDLGYRREVVYKTIFDAGIDMTFNGYNMAIHRIRKMIETEGFNPLTITAAIQNLPVEKTVLNTTNLQDATPSFEVEAEYDNAIDNTSSVTHLSDTLKKSVAVGAKDYSKAAMQKLNNQRKNK